MFFGKKMMIKAIFFDMFNTLADPHSFLEHTESDVLGMEPQEWNSYVWKEDIARDRGLGVIKTEDELMDRICSVLPMEVTKEQKEALKLAHRERLRKCMTEISPEVLDTVKTLKRMGFSLGVISNADVTDNASWSESPLYPYFDDAVFSCDVGFVKPGREIYERALSRLGAKPEEAVFIGDGGSEEHKGAKELGMITVCAEHMTVWDAPYMESMEPYIDRHVKDLREIPGILSEYILSSELVKDIDRYISLRQELKPLADKTARKINPKRKEYEGISPSFGFIVSANNQYTNAELPDDLEKRIKQREETFQQHLFRIIDRKGLDDVDVYKKAGVDRRLFSKIKSNVDYRPKKGTAIAFAIALGLNLDETKDLLGRAGYTISKSTLFDILIGYCIESGERDIIKVNMILDRFGQPLLGA